MRRVKTQALCVELVNGIFPNLFVVGAPKAGTSSLYDYLGRHPGIFIPPIKELHHFSCPEAKDTYYKTNFIESFEDYIALYRGINDENWAGDFSPSYLYNSRSASRIANYNFESKIVVMLRNPVERALSHYLMDIQQGLQKNSLQTSLDGSPNNRFYYKEYIEVGLYSQQLERYYQHFPKEQIFIGLYDELVNDPQSLIASIFRFLGLPAIEIDTSIQHNKFKQPRNRLLGKLTQSNFATAISKKLSGDLKTIAKKIVFSERRPDFGLEREFLTPFFSKDLIRLEQLTDIDLSSWK